MKFKSCLNRHCLFKPLFELEYQLESSYSFFPALKILYDKCTIKNLEVNSGTTYTKSEQEEHNNCSSLYLSTLISKTDYLMH